MAEMTLPGGGSPGDAPAPVVMDNGSHSIKAGFAGEDAPKEVFQNVVGGVKKALKGTKISGVSPDGVVVGDDVISKRDVLDVDRPVDKGEVVNWDDAERSWRHAFSLLGAKPEDQALLVTDNCYVTDAHREKMAQVLFESVGVPALYVANQQVLCLYASGRTSGVVLDVGYGSSRSVPVYEGYALPHACKVCGIGAQDLDLYLMKLLTERGYSFNSVEDREAVSEIKKKLCYVALDAEEEAKRGGASESSDLEQSFGLPDGNVVTVGTERFRCPEALFRPGPHIGLENEGVSAMLKQTVRACDTDFRPGMLIHNVVLAGGTCRLKGMAERLTKELQDLETPSSALDRKVKVVAPEQPHSVWIGGSILASLSTFEDMWVDKKDYEEHGPSIIKKKCS